MLPHCSTALLFFCSVTHCFGQINDDDDDDDDNNLSGVFGLTLLLLYLAASTATNTSSSTTLYDYCFGCKLICFILLLLLFN